MLITLLYFIGYCFVYKAKIQVGIGTLKLFTKLALPIMDLDERGRGE